MWVGKGLVIGIVVSLLAGAGVFAVQAGAQSNAARIDDSPISVPVGRIGDRVTYAKFEREGADEGWERRDDWGFEVAKIVQAPDAQGGFRPSVAVMTTPYKGWPWPHYYYFDILEHDVDKTKNFKIDLASRSIVANSWDWESPVIPGLVGTTIHKGANTHYGPFTWGISAGPDQYEGFPGVVGGEHEYWPLAFQGRTVQLGAGLGDLSTVILADTSNDWALEGSVIPKDFQFGAAVVDRRMVGVYDSYDIRYDGCMRFYTYPESWTWGLEELLWLGVPVPFDALVCYQVDMWVSADVSYPVLVETRINLDGQPYYSRLESLAALNVGSDPIPWEDPATKSAPARWNAWSGDPESSQTPYPDEGSGTPLAFGLREAIGLVQDSPLLLRFSAWKAQHPNHFLIGYSLTPREGGLHRWTLVFGDAPDDTFVVTVQKEPGRPAQPPREEGEFKIEDTITTTAIDPDSYYDLTTISFVAKQWATTMQVPGSSDLPNLVRWGDQYRPPTLVCRSANDCTREEARVVDWDPGFMLIGRTTALGSAGPVDNGALEPLQSSEDSYLVGSIGSGFGLYVSGHAQEFGRFEALPGAGTPPTEASPRTVAAGTPELGPAALLSSSLLAIFLAVYFFPLLKQTSVEVALAVAGYAKLHKKEILNNTYRDRIVALVRAEPGITAPELKARVGGSLSTIVYHMRVLGKNHLVSNLIDGRHKRFFPTDKVSWGERGRLAALRNAKTRELYDLIHDEPGLAPKDLSHRTGISRPTVYWHVDRLARVGLVAHDRERGRARFYASDPNFRPPTREPADGMEVA